VDYRDADGMRRYAITPAGATETRMKSDDSANEDELVAYFTWFKDTYRCKHYALVLLNHGGRLDEMCLDLQPDTADKFWMSGRVLGGKLRVLKEKVAGWELLFFQQCGRGSLENLYSFRGTADYVMFSPAKIGAPNTYYTALHKWLATTPDATGAQVAEKIAAEDTDFTVYACAKAALLDEIPERLDSVFSAFAGKAGLSLPNPLPISIYRDNDTGECTRDAALFLEKFAAHNKLGVAEAAAFSKWLRDGVTVWYQPKTAARVKPVCVGPSLFVPADHEEAARYAEMDLYKKCRLGTFWSELFPDPRPAASK
jgi:hypothetical protein